MLFEQILSQFDEKLKIANTFRHAVMPHHIQDGLWVRDVSVNGHVCVGGCRFKYFTRVRTGDCSTRSLFGPHSDSWYNREGTRYT